MKHGKVEICVLKLPKRPSSKLHSVCQSGKPDWEGACSFSLSSPLSLFRNKLGKYCPLNNCTLGSFRGWGSRAWGRGGRSDSSRIQIVHWEMTFLSKTQELEQEAGSVRLSSWYGLLSLSGSFCSWAQEDADEGAERGGLAFPGKDPTASTVLPLPLLTPVLESTLWERNK